MHTRCQTSDSHAWSWHAEQATELDASVKMRAAWQMRAVTGFEWVWHLLCGAYGMLPQQRRCTCFGLGHLLPVYQDSLLWRAMEAWSSNISRCRS